MFFIGIVESGVLSTNKKNTNRIIIPIKVSISPNVLSFDFFSVVTFSIFSAIIFSFSLKNSIICFSLNKNNPSITDSTT